MTSAGAVTVTQLDATALTTFDSPLMLVDALVKLALGHVPV